MKIKSTLWSTQNCFFFLEKQESIFFLNPNIWMLMNELYPETLGTSPSTLTEWHKTFGI